MATAMQHDSHAGRGRRAARSIGSVLFAYPYAIVTVPLAVFLLGHVVLAIPGLWEAAAAGDRHALVRCLPCVAAILAFAVLTLGYAAARFVDAWKNTKSNNGGESDGR